MYLKCPRKVYYAYRGHETKQKITAQYIEHLLLKELAITCPDVVKRLSSNVDKLSEELEYELHRILEEITDIYPKELADTETEIMKEAETQVGLGLEEIVSNIENTISQIGKEELLRYITPIETEPYLHSDRLKLTGIPSKLVQIENKITPSIIRTGNMPENGVWSNDRMHITALCMLAEEEYEQVLEHGIVEYASKGIARKVRIRTNDRRQVLKIKKRVENIVNGNLPERKESKLCNYCDFKDTCTTKSSLASKLF